MIAKDWESCRKRVEEIEATYWYTDGMVSKVTGSIVINVGLQSDDRNSDSDSVSAASTIAGK